MLTIYRILADEEHYQSLIVDDLELTARPPLDGLPVGAESSGWTPPKARVSRPELPRGDFWGIPDASAFVSRPPTRGMLVTFAHQSCELLPIEVAGIDEQLYIYHVTHVVNFLDKKRTVLDESGRIQKYAIKQNRVGGYSLCKLPETRTYETLCCEDTESGPEDDFKSFVETHGLTGLRFEAIWPTGPSR